LMSINGIQPMTEDFVATIPQVFRPQLEGRFPTMGITAEILMKSFGWIREQPMMDFDMFATPNDHNNVLNELVKRLSLGSSSFIKSRLLIGFTTLSQKMDKAEHFLEESVTALEEAAHLKSKPVENLNRHSVNDSTRIFLTREKDATIQQEASVVCLKHELGSMMGGDVCMLQQTTPFAQVYNRIDGLSSGCALILCLTQNVLHCNWSMAEVILAVEKDLFIIPVQVDTNFPYPMESFYQEVRAGKIIDFGAANSEILFGAVEKLLKSIFEEIALPFNANASDKAIRAMSAGIVKRYEDCVQHASGSGVGGQIGSRLREDQREALRSFLNIMKTRRQSLTKTHGIPVPGAAAPAPPAPVAPASAKKPSPRNAMSLDDPETLKLTTPGLVANTVGRKSNHSNSSEDNTRSARQANNDHGGESDQEFYDRRPKRKAAPRKKKIEDNADQSLALPRERERPARGGRERAATDKSGTVASNVLPSDIVSASTFPQRKGRSEDSPARTREPKDPRRGRSEDPPQMDMGRQRTAPPGDNGAAPARPDGKSKQKLLAF